MKDLIEALTILLKYGNPSYPTCCEHDVLIVHIDASTVSAEDLARLETLGFRVTEEYGEPCFHSFRFGAS